MQNARLLSDGSVLFNPASRSGEVACERHVRVPIHQGAHGYDLILGLEESPQTATQVQVYLDGVLVTTLNTQYLADRYHTDVEHRVVERLIPGRSLLELKVPDGTTGLAGISYVRYEPTRTTGVTPGLGVAAFRVRHPRDCDELCLECGLREGSSVVR